MIEEAIVDAYTESEQVVGFHATLDQHLQCPFDTVVLGTTVTVKKIDGQIEDNGVEPARPEGLGNLTPALDSFIDIVGIDRDLVTAAAEGASPSAPRSSPRNVDRWLATLDTTEHLTMLSRVARGDRGVGAELARRFRQYMRGRATTLPLRTAGELRARAAVTVERRRKAAEEREARVRAVREREDGRT